MKLSYITAGNIPSRWAHSIQVMKMAHAFKQTGHDVEMISSCSIKDWHKDISNIVWEHYGITTPFRLTRLPLDRLVASEQKKNLGRFSYGYCAALLAKYRKTDVLFARDYLAPYWSSMMGLSTIAETHAEPDNTYRKKKLYEATHMDSFKALITISDLLAEKYVQIGVPEKKILVEQDGVDMSLFSSINEVAVAIVRRELLENRKAVVLYAGHLYDYKGIPLILKIAKELPNISFVLVGGWDSDVKRVRILSEDAGLNNVKLTGFVPQSKIPVYLKAADILLLPYSGKHHQASTTSPLKLFEYMASERPIVASSISNVINVLNHNSNAILCLPDSVESFIDGIRDLHADKDKTRRLAQQALKEVQRYDWRERANRILKFARF